MKEKINAQYDKIIAGSLKKELIEVIIRKEVCIKCQSITRHVESTRIWSKATRGEPINPWRMTQEVHGKGMLDCNQSLPYRKVENTKHIPHCADCVDRAVEEKPWKGK